MGSFQYNRAISGSILNTPLGDPRFYEHNGQITLASDGGQGVVALAAATNQTSAHGVPLATELEATIDTVALHAIQERVDDGTGRAPTPDPSQTTLVSAAAEFRIANYGATDTDEFLFFQS